MMLHLVICREAFLRVWTLEQQGNIVMPTSSGLKPIPLTEEQYTQKGRGEDSLAFAVSKMHIVQENTDKSADWQGS
jgi:hypothetical protein